MKKLKKCLLLFFDFFKIGLFTFGGGYAMISTISSEIVDKRKYISQEEFSDVVAIAESTPGPIAINSATYIGYRVAGFLGSIVSSLAVSLPSFIIIFLISKLLPNFLGIELVQKAFRGVQCAVVVLIVMASVKLIKNVKRNALSVILIILSSILLALCNIFSVNISTIWFILVAGAIGFAFYYPKARKEKAQKQKLAEENAEIIESNNQVKASNEKEADQ